MNWLKTISKLTWILLFLIIFITVLFLTEVLKQEDLKTIEYVKMIVHYVAIIIWLCVFIIMSFPNDKLILRHIINETIKNTIVWTEDDSVSFYNKWYHLLRPDKIKVSTCFEKTIILTKNKKKRYVTDSSVTELRWYINDQRRSNGNRF